MEKKPYPSEIQERFIVRFPDGMRDRIAEASRDANRSMNAEIVSRIQLSFDQPLMKLLSDELDRSESRSGKLQHLTDLIEAQRKTIGSQEVNLIVLSTYLVDVINSLPKKLRNEDRIKAAAQFVLGLVEGVDMSAQQSMLQFDTPLTVETVKAVVRGKTVDTGVVVRSASRASKKR